MVSSNFLENICHIFHMLIGLDGDTTYIGIEIIRSKIKGRILALSLELFLQSIHISDAN